MVSPGVHRDAGLNIPLTICIWSVLRNVVSMLDSLMPGHNRGIVPRRRLGLVLTYPGMVKMLSSPRLISKTPSSQPANEIVVRENLIDMNNTLPLGLVEDSATARIPVITRPIPISVLRGALPSELSNLEIVRPYPQPGFELQGVTNCFPMLCLSFCDGSYRHPV